MLMRFPSPLIAGPLISRYKRFLADIELEGGAVVTAHCANPGSMLGLAAPGSRVWLSRSDKPGRKLPFSWELIEVDLGRGPALDGMPRGSQLARDGLGDPGRGTALGGEYDEHGGSAHAGSPLAMRGCSAT